MVIRVFGAVEGQGVGFLKNGKPKILFERHRMYAYLRLKKGTAFANKMEAERPNIVNRKYGGYQGNEAEYVRLEQAKQIDVECALMSASWGQFQIMGENWKDLGYASAQDFVDQQFASESFQLEAFIRFISLSKALVSSPFLNASVFFCLTCSSCFSSNAIVCFACLSSSRTRPMNVCVLFAINDIYYSFLQR